MNVPFYDLKKVQETHRKELVNAFQRVFDTGHFVLGRELICFEKEFAKYCGTKECVGVGSGLDALYLILKSIGVSSEHEVIVPAHTFIATWLSVTYSGAKIVPVDIELHTYNIDPTKIESVITSRTKAIVVVHLYGHPVLFDEISEIANRYKLRIIEDAAQSHGAAYRLRKVGSLGNAAAFSFYPSKNMGALGDGGCVCTNDKSISNNIRSLRNYGEKVKYIYKEKGQNSRLDEIQAAFLRTKLAILDKMNESRRNTAKIYSGELRCLEPKVTLPTEDMDCTHVYHQYVIRCNKRDNLKSFLQNKNISTLVHYPIPPHKQKAYQEYSNYDLSVAEEVSKTCLSIPIFPYMTDEQIDYVIKNIKTFFENRF